MEALSSQGRERDSWLVLQTGWRCSLSLLPLELNLHLVTEPPPSLSQCLSSQTVAKQSGGLETDPAPEVGPLIRLSQSS